MSAPCHLCGEPDARYVAITTPICSDDEPAQIIGACYAPCCEPCSKRPLIEHLRKGDDPLGVGSGPSQPTKESSLAADSRS